MEPWQSWGVVSVAAVAAYLYYSRSGKFKRGRLQPPSIVGKSLTNDSKLSDGNRSHRKRAKNADALDKNMSDVAEVSAASNPASEKGLKKRKGSKKPVGQLAQSSAVDVGPAPVQQQQQQQQQQQDSDDAVGHDLDNAEFAKQLSERKTGTSLNKPVTGADTRRTKKPGKRDEAPPVLVNGLSHTATSPPNPSGVSAASSTTGADADDDLSPAVSPEIGATRTPTTAGDISDMLEVPRNGPSVLRLTQSAVPQENRPPRPSKPVPEPETKKQRQNRKKNEEKKMAREEEEKERRVRLEKQLRTAREAEGRPAKNGLGTPPASVANNAWNKAGGEGARQGSSLAGDNEPLLDTLDLNAPDAASKQNSDRGDGSSAEQEWKSELPSEEEQMRLLTELDGNGWNTVKKNTKAKKKTGDAGGGLSGSDHRRPPADENVSAAQWKSALGASGSGRQENVGESTNSTTSDSGVDVSQPENGSGNSTSSYVKKPMVDPKIWNRENIHNHPDYDSRYPFALVGHPEDSDWAVV